MYQYIVLRLELKKKKVKFIIKRTNKLSAMAGTIDKFNREFFFSFE
jgi:hypothetical protein